MTDERQAWISDVNDDFSGKMRSDPPSGFFDIVRDKHIELFGWNENEDDEWEIDELSVARVSSQGDIIQYGAKLDYSRQTANVENKIRSMAISQELAQLEVNKEDLGVSQVIFEPAYGLILIKLDLKSLNINPEHASFIDLEVNAPLNFEIKFHI